VHAPSEPRAPQDNHDAEPFLNRVLKQEAPDYYDSTSSSFLLVARHSQPCAVIQHPMDLGTMLRRVKGKHYRSKKEFKDDLDLIWSNCFAYNHAPVRHLRPALPPHAHPAQDHPIRLKAVRLRAKAETLLAAITDRRERTDLWIPNSLAAVVAPPSPPPDRDEPMPPAPLANGHVNGTPQRRPAVSRRPTTSSAVPKAKVPPPPQEVQFPETPAVIRTAAGMAAFLALDADLTAALAESVEGAIAGPGPSSLASIEERLRAHLPPSSSETEEYGEELSPLEDELVGGKRKLSVFASLSGILC
jgi:transcriptional activator SPT7